MTITNRTFNQGLLVAIRLTGLLFLAAIIVLPGLGPTYAESQADAQMVQPEPEAPAVSHNTWTSGAALPTAVVFATAAVLKNEIYVIAGATTGGTVADVQIYNPVTNSWSTGASYPVAIDSASAAVVKKFGTVFEVSTTGIETVLYSFTQQKGDGAYPNAGLLIDKKGDLYGTTEYGGVYGHGTVFKLTP